jgi:glycosidase
MTLRGTPYIYQGQEIGMMNPTFKSIDEFRDIESHHVYDQLIAEGKTSDEVIEILNNGSRDNSRTVMSWSDELNAGFSTCDPWIKVNDDYKSVNVKTQLKDYDSTYHFYKTLIKIRKENLTLIYGKTLSVHKKLADVMSFKRQLDKDEFLVVVNLSDNTRDIPLSMKKYELIVSNYADANVLYKPYEARIYKRTV